MIISFSVQNWMSFQKKTSISLVASREKQHSERLPEIERYDARILPTSVIYGGNASGKTNLFKALSFIKHLVVRGTHPSAAIPVEVFLLESKSAEQPATFSIEILAEEKMYRFSFSATRKAVLHEQLVEVTTTKEKILYERHKKYKDGIKFDDSLDKDLALHFVFKGTRDNQLFLTNSISQKVETFRPIYNWFENSLQLVAPDSRFGRFERFLEDGSPMLCGMREGLSRLDTGITNIDFESVRIEDLECPKEMLDDIEDHLKDDGDMVLVMPLDRNPIALARQKDKLVARRLVTFHSNQRGQDVKFGMDHESDGTRRIFDLLPVFIDLCSEESNKVYVIDELDRSLHTLLTKSLLEGYLATCSPQSRAQLLFTTHDVLLMDQELLRRDEMWVAERTRTGASTLTSFSEYKDVRSDKDIRKSYLQGRLGGVPRVFFNSRALRSSPEVACNQSP